VGKLDGKVVVITGGWYGVDCRRRHHGSLTAETVVVMGKPSKTNLEACWELGSTVAAQLMK
jgi:hypothetical protein